MVGWGLEIRNLGWLGRLGVRGVFSLLSMCMPKDIGHLFTILFSNNHSETGQASEEESKVGDLHKGHLVFQSLSLSYLLVPRLALICLGTKSIGNLASVLRILLSAKMARDIHLQKDTAASYTTFSPRRVVEPSFSGQIETREGDL